MPGIERVCIGCYSMFAVSSKVVVIDCVYHPRSGVVRTCGISVVAVGKLYERMVLSDSISPLLEGSFEQ